MKPYRVEFYRDSRKLWRWRLIAPNNRNVANGSEGYASWRNARRAASKVGWVFRRWEYVEVTRG